LQGIKLRLVLTLLQEAEQMLEHIDIAEINGGNLKLLQVHGSFYKLHQTYFGIKGYNQRLE